MDETLERGVQREKKGKINKDDKKSDKLEVKELDKFSAL